MIKHVINEKIITKLISYARQFSWMEDIQTSSEYGLYKLIHDIFTLCKDKPKNINSLFFECKHQIIK